MCVGARVNLSLQRLGEIFLVSENVWTISSFVSLYVCLRACERVSACVHVFVFVFARACTCTCACACACMCACLSASVCTGVRVCVREHVRAGARRCGYVC